MPTTPGYVVAYRDDVGCIRYLIARRMGRRFSMRPVRPDLAGYGWTVNPKRATIYPSAEQAQTRAARFGKRNAWVEPSDHI